MAEQKHEEKSELTQPEYPQEMYEDPEEVPDWHEHVIAEIDKKIDEKVGWACQAKTPELIPENKRQQIHQSGCNLVNKLNIIQNLTKKTKLSESITDSQINLI
eukprot:244811_1